MNDHVTILRSLLLLRRVSLLVCSMAASWVGVASLEGEQSTAGLGIHLHMYPLQCNCVKVSI